MWVTEAGWEVGLLHWTLLRTSQTLLANLLDEKLHWNESAVLDSGGCKYNFCQPTSTKQRICAPHHHPSCLNSRIQTQAPTSCCATPRSWRTAICRQSRASAWRTSTETLSSPLMWWVPSPHSDFWKPPCWTHSAPQTGHLMEELCWSTASVTLAVDQSPADCSDLMLSLRRTLPRHSRDPNLSLRACGILIILPGFRRAAVGLLPTRRAPTCECVLPFYSSLLQLLASPPGLSLTFVFLLKPSIFSPFSKRSISPHLRMCFTPLLPVLFNKVIFSARFLTDYLRSIHLERSVVLFRMQCTPAYLFGRMHWRLLAYWGSLQVKLAG